MHYYKAKGRFLQDINARISRRLLAQYHRNEFLKMTRLVQSPDEPYFQFDSVVILGPDQVNRMDIPKEHFDEEGRLKPNAPVLSNIQRDYVMYMASQGFAVRNMEVEPFEDVVNILLTSVFGESKVRYFRIDSDVYIASEKQPDPKYNNFLKTMSADAFEAKEFEYKSAKELERQEIIDALNKEMAQRNEEHQQRLAQAQLSDNQLDALETEEKEG